MPDGDTIAACAVLDAVNGRRVRAVSGTSSDGSSGGGGSAEQRGDDVKSAFRVRWQWRER